MVRDIRVCIDRGGTFTDCLAETSIDGKTRQVYVCKLLSEDPARYPDAPREGIRRLLETITGVPHPKTKPVDTSRLQSIRMATTVATNALLERKGEPFALLITTGFKDLLHIGNQTRPNIFELCIPPPNLLYERVIEVNERVRLAGYSAGGTETIQVSSDNIDGRPNFTTGVTNELIEIMKPLDLKQVAHQLKDLLDSGIKNIAVALLHSYVYPQHELQIQELAQDMGFQQITLSSQIMPMIKLVTRGTSACVDAYLTPCIKRYLQSFASGFDKNLDQVQILFMQSDGGLTPMDQFSGFKAIVSGPAAGYVGYACTTYNPVERVPVIGFDMGGTSTDVSRYDGIYEHVYETSIDGISLQAPQLDIQTVAAGGGSRLFYRNGLFIVGPESAGANPGPTSYRKGGPLTVTDANLVLGRLVPQFFPKIFGPNENEPLDFEGSVKGMQELRDQINADRSFGQQLSIDEVAMGFIQVANESMCRPIRNLTQGRGRDTKKHILNCFGGAGGQHACAIARTLGINTVVVHRYSSVLSAYGLALADVVKEKQQPFSGVFKFGETQMMDDLLQKLRDVCVEELRGQGFEEDRIKVEYFLNLRYQGTDSPMMTLYKPGKDISADFGIMYQREYGFLVTDRDLVIDDIRIRASGISDSSSLLKEEEKELWNIDKSACTLIDSSKARLEHSVYLDGLGRVMTRVFMLDQIEPFSIVPGPALILDRNSTILVEPGFEAYVTKFKDVLLKQSSKKNNSSTSLDVQLDPIQLSIFSHRFMSIAEQMGQTLRRIAVSTNIKERLDFSCALFGPDGGLVANAPHIPVHLGSMQEAVRYQLDYYKTDLLPGDVIVSNHPLAGGSHLPDITVITPVFDQGNIIFFVASRGHHADIGGISPGSMPPHSNELYQEGAAIISLKLVKGGVFQEAAITKCLLHDPAQYVGSSGTRNIQDNLSDLKAQIAANQRGVKLVGELIQEYGIDVVHSYMNYIRFNAEQSVRQLLKKVAKDRGSPLVAADFMDDGSPIVLNVTIDSENGSAVFDFSKSGPQVYGNLNAPRSVTFSAVIYCLRCMVGMDIPLNQGCLAPIQIILQQGSILSPDESAAVVGGNVLTSQRLVDVILKAFGACAASQGCMNNLTFGVPAQDQRLGWGYYETIAGGAGAGPGWQGRDGVHTHMTNTRMTDSEVLEKRYPVLLHRFQLRKGSGGRGTFSGGDGVIREIEFETQMQVSILSERRVLRPFGLHGGESGKSGLNLLYRKKSDSFFNLGGKNSVTVEAGDRIIIETPGGGGYKQS